MFADHEMKDNEVEAQGDGRNIRTLCWKLARAHHTRVSEELEEAHVLSRQNVDKPWVWLAMHTVNRDRDARRPSDDRDRDAR